MYKWIKYPLIAVLVLVVILMFLTRRIDTNLVVLDHKIDPPQIKHRIVESIPSIKPSSRNNTVVKEQWVKIPGRVVSSSPYVPLKPVKEDDWDADLPTYNVSEDVRKTDWWKAAAFLELDFRERKRDYKCRRMALQGNWYVCLDGKWNIRPPCLVYSFGIGFDFSFDDDMTELGCEVHSFDPSMGLKDHVRNTSVHFHPIGIGGENIENFNPRMDLYVHDEQSWTIMTLGTVMAALGHTGRTIDLLKIDVEGHEWAVIDYLIDNGFLPKIKQFSLEYHLFPDWPKKSDYTKLLSTYKRLHDEGFRKFYTGIHPLFHDPEKFNIQADIGYVNFNYRRT
ncbi:hypothetical protein FSP39_009832 [Pinctada imbricata]|uniref:Methyltransferase domain-containing protein n=1 Tax=Pinctada imbricata TaxID=66713 RepID=A0AA89BQW1_PINIB|nr:hypothetical protein FSP39_009832 [Pinctada imbricata]